MTEWEGRTADGVFAVQLEEQVLKTLDRLCGEAGRKETGGILIGRYSSDRSMATVLEATPPPSDSRRGRFWFVRGVNGLREMLAGRWQAEERTYYVGEWHFHPVDQVSPSGDDFRQMLDIGRAQAYDCKHPLLVIVGASRGQGFRPLRTFVCPSGKPPLELMHSPGLFNAAPPRTERTS